MQQKFMFFKDRTDAGRQLARKLEHLRRRNHGQDALVLALPRGGVPVAREVAKYLRAPIDVFVARKLGAPGNSEFGVGAIAEGGIIVTDRQAMNALGLTDQDLQRTINAESAELQRRITLYRGNQHNVQVKNKTVILVDDGLATGVTALAAIRSLKLSEPKTLILAVPVCASDTANKLQNEVDELVCLQRRDDFAAVGQWYDNFEQLTDQDVIAQLAE